MDKEIIQQIATEVVHRLPFGDHPWFFLLVTAILMALAAGVAAWAGAFLKIKGQNFATKKDFDDLQDQLKANTELIETIKSEISQRDWAQREWANLRRIKLEALVEKMHECEAYLARSRDSAIKGEIAQAERDYIDELDVLAGLYFPELENEVKRFAGACRSFAIFTITCALCVMDARSDNDKHVAVKNFRVEWADRYPEFLAARIQLMKVARSLLMRIMDVDDKSAALSDGG